MADQCSFYSLLVLALTVWETVRVGDEANMVRFKSYRLLQQSAGLLKVGNRTYDSNYRRVQQSEFSNDERI